MSYNINLDSIREVYKSMSNEEILVFAREEGIKLSTDAYLALKGELGNRDIGKDIMDGLDHQIILEYSLRQRKFEEDINKDLFVSSLEFALAWKKEGKSQYAIYVGLIERGISEPYANYMINKLDEWAESLHKDSVNDLQVGAVLLMFGCFALYITLTIKRFEISAALIIFTGIIKILQASDRKKRYRKIINQFRLDK